MCDAVGNTCIHLSVCVYIQDEDSFMSHSIYIVLEYYGGKVVTISKTIIVFL